MISFSDIEKVFSFSSDKGFCIEIEFKIKDDQKYRTCWMGKMPDENNQYKDLYWYGLTPDGTEAYDYDNFAEFCAAPVFDGKSLKTVWDKVIILSIDGCDPEKRFSAYII